MKKYKEINSELVKGILEEAAKINQELILPLAKAGDENPCVYENGVVRTPPGYKEVYKKFIEDGWTSLSCDPKYGGQGIPKTVSTFFEEMLSSSSLAFKLYSELSIGAYNCILTHAEQSIKDKFLPKIVEGKWSGTMDNLSGPYSSWYDKAHLLKGKTANWTKEQHQAAGFRMTPNSPVRPGSFIGKNAVLMPCYVNIGAYIGAGTMMDTFSRAGSCCQIGENCHISAGSGIGGVLEPAQALPTIIEDNVFVGAMSEVVEGVILGEGSVLSMGCYIGQSTKIVNRSNGEITKGYVPPYSVVVPGTHKDLYAVHIIKTVDAKTRSKTSINDLLRE